MQLEPCPGCGRSSTRVIGGPGTVAGPQYWAGCDYCLWRAIGDTEAEAIETWNTRAFSHGLNYKTFTDGMEAAAQICGGLAETTYDDTDAFEAATGCEAAIMRVVRQQRTEQAASAQSLTPTSLEGE